ncbi:hypothetical protein [Ferruginibacter sp.]
MSKYISIIILSIIFCISLSVKSQSKKIEKAELIKIFRNEQYSPIDSITYMIGAEHMVEGAVKLDFFEACYNDSTHIINLKGKVSNNNRIRNYSSLKTKICICENIGEVTDSALIKAGYIESLRLVVKKQLYETDDKGNFNISLNANEIKKIYFSNRYLVCGSLSIGKLNY